MMKSGVRLCRWDSSTTAMMKFGSETVLVVSCRRGLTVMKLMTSFNSGHGRGGSQIGSDGSG